ncbi:MAG: hypothetical protein WKF30_14700 [Pyrinomonadaceae bacterium]
MTAFRRGQLLRRRYCSATAATTRTMGIITAVLVAGELLAAGPQGDLPEIPLWVV